MMQKQQGFTLLELLVVITLLAVLSVGALVAYEGIGDNAQATAAANNTATVDRTIRTYRAVSLQYPNQWDNLSASGAVGAYGAGNQFAAATKAAFGSWNVAANPAVKSAVFGAFENVGIDEVQQLGAAATQLADGVAPNLQHNEGANANAAEVEMADAAFTHVSIMPSSLAAGGCTAGSATLSRAFADTADVNGYNTKLNAVNDSLDTGACQLVVALGFGHDAAHSTAGSPAAIVTAATYSSKNVNPATHYARYISLFHLGTDGANGGTVDGNIDSTEIFTKARLLAVVDPEGNSIDANIAKATQAN